MGASSSPCNGFFAALKAAILLTTVLHAVAFADITAMEIRAGSAFDGFDGARETAAVYHWPSTQRYRIDHFEVAVGGIFRSGDTSAFLSVGPAWRFELGSRFYANAGISPTILSNSSLGDKDLGGRVHFTSVLSIGTSLGQSRRLNVALQVQHISNGGLNDRNPGIEMVGLSFTLYPDRP